jgi:hypothetical protein
MVVRGNMNLNPGRSMMMSPGRWNKCIRLSQGQSRPAVIRTAPRAMRIRFMCVRTVQFTSKANHPAGDSCFGDPTVPSYSQESSRNEIRHKRSRGLALFGINDQGRPGCSFRGHQMVHVIDRTVDSTSQRKCATVQSALRSNLQCRHP